MAREISYVHARVLAKHRVSPHLARVVLAPDEAAGWASSGVPDEALLIVMPEPDTGRVGMPDQVGEGAPSLRGRSYTVRDVDAARGEITIDVVLHEVGLATHWVRTARVGDPVGISSTHHWYALGPDVSWQYLFG